jgi:hypothetical protein
MTTIPSNYFEEVCQSRGDACKNQSICETSDSHAGKYQNDCLVAVVLCSLIEVIALMIEAASPSETLVNFYQSTTWCNNPRRQPSSEQYTI